MTGSDALLKELLETFQVEAQDHLGALSTLLVELEYGSDAAERTQLVETIFRRMHTLKGAAHAVNLTSIAHSCQELENLLADLKRGNISLDLGLFDRLHAEIDDLSKRIVARRENGAPGAGAASPPPPGQPLEKAQRFAAGKGAWSGSNGPGEEEAATAVSGKVEGGGDERGAQNDRTPAHETVRVSTRLLESLLLQAEELVSAKLAASALLEEASAAASELSGRRNDLARGLELARNTLRKPQPEAAAKLARLVQDGCQTERRTESRLRALEKSAEKHLWSLRGMIDPLLEDMKKLHLLPFSSLTDPFSKLVRDLARELNKEAEFSCSGGEIEIDRRILAELKEPLLHIVRNVMDHGIEKGAERRLKGKPEKGKIRIEMRLQDANLAEVVIADDGRGIDLAQVKATALRLELVKPEAMERMPDAEALQLIFQSGVSTSPIITSLSGRGVGLAIVRESLEKLGGYAAVDSRPGEGTEFRLCLPLSFAMMRCLLVETAGRACLLPAANVELTARLPSSEIKSVENRNTVLLAGEVVSLVSLARLLELDEQSAADPGQMQSVVLVSAADKRIAFAVEHVAGVQEILVKPLGSQLARVRNVSGATVLGNGLVVPILNIGDLFRSALLRADSTPAGAPPLSRTGTRQVTVLVAEDSITSRTLLKNILESSGFRVQTAIDGRDALSLLRTGSFDIVVSDVEMPRMDGFELTAAIRSESRWANLPVVLVTGLESRSDRERGIEVGASAYIVKSSFDQSSLVEVIQKLT